MLVKREDCLWYVQTALQLWLVKEQLGGRATKITHKLFVYRGKQNTVNRQKLLTQKPLTDLFDSKAVRIVNSFRGNS